MSANYESDQMVAFAISKRIRRYLANHPPGEDKVNRACDILALAQWLVSGPGWSGENQVPDVRNDPRVVPFTRSVADS